MPFLKRKKRNYFRKSNARTRRSNRRVYRAGYSRFGKISTPELKHNLLQRSGTLTEDTPLVINLPPVSISQGVGEAYRIGNRINGKFLNTRLCLKSRMSESAVGAFQRGTMLRYAIWQGKDPAGAIPPVWQDPMTLVSFLNTKRFRIIKTGYITFSALGGTKVVTWNIKLGNRTMEFSADGDSSVNTKSRYYLTLFSTRDIDFDIMSKFYFSDL